MSIDTKRFSLLTNIHSGVRLEFVKEYVNWWFHKWNKGLPTKECKFSFDNCVKIFRKLGKWQWRFPLGVKFGDD